MDEIFRTVLSSMLKHLIIRIKGTLGSILLAVQAHEIQIIQRLVGKFKFNYLYLVVDDFLHDTQKNVSVKDNKLERRSE